MSAITYMAQELEVYLQCKLHIPFKNFTYRLVCSNNYAKDCNSSETFAAPCQSPITIINPSLLFSTLVSRIKVKKRKKVWNVSLTLCSEAASRPLRPPDQVEAVVKVIFHITFFVISIRIHII